MANLVSNIKRYFRGYLDRVLWSNEIRKIDHYSRSLNIINNDPKFLNLKSQGYYIDKNFLPEDLRKDLLFNYINSKEYFTRSHLKLFEFIKNHYLKVITSYLGGEVVICNYTYIESKGENIISGDWHTDNVGHKLNLMFCLEGYGNCPTFYIAKSHKKKYFPSLREQLREFKYDNSKQKDLPESIRIDYFSNDVAMFDGNGLHRGAYEKSSENKRRLNIVIDFVRIEKIYNLGFRKEPSMLFLKSKKNPYRQKSIEDLKRQMKKIDKDIIKNFMNFSFFREEFITKEGPNYYYPW